MYLSRRRCLLAALNTEPHPLNLSLSRSLALALSLSLWLSLSPSRSLARSFSLSFSFYNLIFFSVGNHSGRGFFSWPPLTWSTVVVSWTKRCQLTTTYMIYMLSLWLTSFSSTNYFSWPPLTWSTCSPYDWHRLVQLTTSVDHHLHDLHALPMTDIV